jgi:GT2 family glycosyltransferase
MSQPVASPLGSIILAVWNSAEYLPRCLEHLAAQTFKDFEVVLVDNGSTDGSLDGVEDSWPSLSLRIEHLGENKGFAAANNLGARLARGQWLALLNTDAFPEPDWLEKLLEAALDNPDFSFFASRQLQANAPHRLDGAGDVFHVSGLTWRRFSGWPSAQFGLAPEEVFSSCGAAALYLRQMFLDVGGFDEDFFSYQEDVDLGFRLRLQGFRCLYVPEAVVHHIGTASTGKKSAFAIYHGHRNLVWTYVKNMPPVLFWLYLPLHLLMNLVFLLHFSIKGQDQAIWRAKRDGLRGLGLMFHKRKEIQRQCRVPVMSLYRLMERNWFAPLKFKVQSRRFARER